MNALALVIIVSAAEAEQRADSAKAKYDGMQAGRDLDDAEARARRPPRADGAHLVRRAAIRAPVSEPIGEDRAEDAVLAGTLAELLGGHQRRGDLEVQAEGAGEEDDARGSAQVRPAAHVARRPSDLRRAARRSGSAVCSGSGSSRAAVRIGASVGRPVDEDHPAGGLDARAERGDQQAGDGGTEDAGDVEAGGVEADGVGDVVAVRPSRRRTTGGRGVERGADAEERTRARRRARSGRRR